MKNGPYITASHYPSFALVLTLLLLIASSHAFSQGKTKIHLVQADRLEYDERLASNVNVFIGNVIFEHDSAYLYCDTAHFDEKNNALRAFGNVRIKVNDTLNLYGKRLIYHGNTRIAEMRKNIRLVDGKTTLFTDYLDYDRNTNISYYLGGGRINSGNNKLESLKGNYYENSGVFVFSDSVKLINKKYTMVSDTLRYNTISEIAYFFGPTEIISKENTIYCENGWYNTRNDESEFRENAQIVTDDMLLTGDSLYYHRVLGIGKAIRNVRLYDTVKDIIILGNHAFYDEVRGYANVKDSARAILINGNDSLYLHARLLKATFDSANETDYLYAYHHVKYYRDDIQGMADSMVYDLKDSSIYFFNDPVLWSEENQLLADTIRIDIRDDKISSLWLINDALIVSEDKPGYFNQIGGQNMAGYFRNNELHIINVYGNSETIYYIRDDKGLLIGGNVVQSGDMTIRLKEKKIDEIVYIQNPDAILYPGDDIPADKRTLKGFKWLVNRRPASRNDIFNW